MKYKSKLVTNYWTENAEQTILRMKEDELNAVVLNSLNDRTNLEIVCDIEGETIDEFFECLKFKVNKLSYWGIDVWSLIDEEKVILTEEENLEAVNNLLSLKVSEFLNRYDVPAEKHKDLIKEKNSLLNSITKKYLKEVLV